MDWRLAAAAVAAGYLCGSVSFARIVRAVFAPGRDISRTSIRVEGSEQTMDFSFVSATTITAHLGMRYGFLVMLLDMFKVAAPTLLFRFAFRGAPYFLLVAAAGFLGHVWPVWYRFRGGRGILAIYAGALAIDPLGMLACSVGGYVFGLFVLRDVLSVYMTGVVLLVPWMWFTTRSPAYLAWAVFINAVFTAAMVPEIRRWVRLRRDPRWADPTVVLEQSGMGRGMLWLGRRVGLVKRRPAG
jgi:glycerol-3-phosphate acyltransferase PlsY